MADPSQDPNETRDGSGEASPGGLLGSGNSKTLAAAAAIAGFAIAVYMAGVVGAIGIAMLSVGFGALGPGLAYLMGNRSINFVQAVAFRAAMNMLMIAVIVLLVYKGVPVVK